MKPRLELWLGMLLAWISSSVLLAQTGSVVTVNSDNALVINGRRVFPIGFSPGPPNNGTTPDGKDALQELRDAGALLFRITQSTSWNSQVISNQQVALDWAAQHGMYCWVNLAELSQFPSTSTNTAASLRSIVDMFRNHPALGLWKNSDEAWWSGVPVTNLLNGYNVIKQEDTNHPVVQTHAPRGTVADLQPYNAAADVLALDIYPVTASGSASNPPITNTQVSQLGDWTKVLSQVAGGRKEYWLIEQIAFSGTTPPAHPLVFPTLTQSRYMAFQAIVNGARGLMFFGGNIAATLNAQDAPYGWNWTFWTNVLRSVVQELGDKSLLADALVAPASALPITFTGTTSPDLEFCVREASPYVYIMACKREGTNANVTFSGLPAFVSTGDVLYETPRAVTVQNGQFTDSFAPLDVHVYRFWNTNQIPTITSQPQNQSISDGESATFSVGAWGTPPLGYQWEFNGSRIPGATASSFSVVSAHHADRGPYSVVVTNGAGAVVSTNALLSFLALNAWGDDTWGQVSFSAQGQDVIALAAGEWHNLALRTDGKVLAWGNDFDGQCDVPPTLPPALAIAAGGYHSLAILQDGTVAAWGASDYGQTNVPAGMSGVIGIGAGTWHSLALRRDGTVAAWGDNTWGQTSVPGGLSNVVAVAAGGNHSLALRSDGTVVAWGEDTDADGISAGQSVVPAGLTNVVAIAAGEYHSLAVRADGTVMAWGDNSQGQVSFPAGLSNIVAVSGGGAHSLALQGNGTLVAWGANWNEQCNVPQGLTNVIGVAAGGYHSLVLWSGSVPAPRLLSPVRQGGRFSAILQTLNRTSYALEYKNSLTASNWSALSTNDGNGALKQLSDAAVAPSQRFYRMREW